jgi:hypothetical protein
VLQRFASLRFRGKEMVATDKEIREAEVMEIDQ